MQHAAPLALQLPATTGAPFSPVPLLASSSAGGDSAGMQGQPAASSPHPGICIYAAGHSAEGSSAAAEAATGGQLKLIATAGTAGPHQQQNTQSPAIAESGEPSAPRKRKQPDSEESPAVAAAADTAASDMAGAATQVFLNITADAASAAAAAAAIAALAPPPAPAAAAAAITATAEAALPNQLARCQHCRRMFCRRCATGICHNCSGQAEEQCPSCGFCKLDKMRYQEALGNIGRPQAHLDPAGEVAA